MVKKSSLVATLVSVSLSAGLGLAAFSQNTQEIARGNCKAASDTCQKTLTYCNEKKGKLGAAHVTNALKDCIDSRNATEKLLARGSALQKKAANLSIDACNNVSKACDQFGSDAKMNTCANEVRKAVGNLQKIQ